MTLAETVARMGDIRGELVELAETVDGQMTEEQQTRWDELNGEFDTLDKQKTDLEKRQARLEQLRSAALDPAQIQSGDGARQFDRDPIGDPNDVANRRENPWDLTGFRTLNRSDETFVAELRSRALDAIALMPGTTDARRAVATRWVELDDPQDGSLSKLILATSSPEYLRAFVKIMGGKESLLNDEERQAVSRAMSLTDASGGYMVPFQLDPTLIITSDGSVNPIRQISRKVVATGDTWNGVSAGHISWSWDAEAAEASDDAPTIAQPSIPIHKAVGFVPISIEAFADIPNVTEEVGKLLAGGKDDLEATAFAVGTGSGQPTGIVTALGAGQTVNSATTDVFAIADVYALEEALPARYRDRASWVGNWPIFHDVRQFGSSDSHALWSRLGEATPERLLGHPKYEASAMDGVINAAAENYVLVIGDFQNYVIADRVGMTVEFLPHLVGTNHRPTGQRGWYAYYRVGADSVNDGAFRRLNVT